MKLYYDRDADALYLRLGDAKVIESEEVRPGIVLDYDDRNRVIGVEVLSVTKQFPEADVKRLMVEVAAA